MKLKHVLIESFGRKEGFKAFVFLFKKDNLNVFNKIFDEKKDASVNFMNLSNHYHKNNLKKPQVIFNNQDGMNYLKKIYEKNKNEIEEMFN